MKTDLKHFIVAIVVVAFLLVGCANDPGKTQGEKTGGLVGKGVGMLIAPGAGLITGPLGEKLGKKAEDDKAKKKALRERQEDREQYKTLKEADPESYKRLQGN